MKIWYEWEQFRVFPNIEITKEIEDDHTLLISFCWMKFVVTIKIGLT